MHILPTTALANPSRDSLEALAEQFSRRIGGKLKEADLMLAGDNDLALMELRSGAVIPEGEPLLLRAATDDGPLGDDIYAIRENNRLMISLANFVESVELPITVNAASGTATGWFFREDQSFYLDARKPEATIAGKAIALDPEDIAIDGEEILVSSTQLEKWFGIDIGIDLSTLSLSLKSSQPLPAEERERRRRRQQYSGEVSDAPRLPLVEEPYRVYSMPYLDVALSAHMRRRDADSDTVRDFDWSVIGAGDFLHFSSRTFASGNFSSSGDSHALNALRQTFSREDAEGDMLGPLGVKWLEFGDIYTPNLPIVAGGVQEQGLFLSTRLPGEVTALSRIDVRGDAQPGWDVELYNNDSLIGLQQVGDDGRFNFESVFLFEGENVMKLVYYGPQGELREEIRRIVSSANGLGGRQSAWDFAATRTNMTTYDAERTERPADGDPRISARYERSLGELGSVNAGFSHRTEEEGEEPRKKDYFQAGVATGALGALLTADAAYDLDGEYAGDILLRRSFGAHQSGLRVQHSSPGFTLAPENNVELNLRGPLAESFLGLRTLSYAADAGYLSDDGASRWTGSASVSARYGNIGLNTGLHYNLARSEESGIDAVTEVEDRLSGDTSVRGYFGRGRWRFSSDYGLQPFDLRTLGASYTYPFSRELQGNAEASHNALTGISELELSARWRPAEVIVSPRVAVDTDHQLAFGVNVNFSLAEDPFTGEYRMSNRTLTDAGGVSARVFLDANGDGLYTEGEELLPEVDIQALQSSARAETSPKGVAFMPDLQRSVRTDVIVAEGTLPDPFYMSMNPGVSVRPRPGITSTVDFPVVVAGEMDGQVSFADEPARRVRGVKIRLVAPDGRTEQTAVPAADGYYAISGVRPGIYYLVADTGEAGGNAPPRLLAFGPEGATYFGENISLAPGPGTAFLFSASNAPAGRRTERVLTPADIAGQRLLLHAGRYRSRLALALAWYRLKIRSDWGSRFTLATPLLDIAPDPKTATMSLPLMPRRHLDMGEAMEACRMLQTEGFACAVETVTTFGDAPAPAKISRDEKKKDAG